jgi:hypothetical protein
MRGWMGMEALDLSKPVEGADSDVEAEDDQTTTLIYDYKSDDEVNKRAKTEKVVFA